MKRKLVQHGESTLVVSLPSKWIKSQKLKKGDGVLFTEKKDILEISAEHKIQSQKEVSYDISNLDRSSTIYLIYAAYKRGFDRLILNFKENKFIHHRTKKKLDIYEEVQKIIQDRLIGFEITTRDNHQIIIEDITPTKNENLSTIIYRIFVLIVEMSQHLLKGMVYNDKEMLYSIQKKHDNITKLIALCLRKISKYEYDKPDKSYSAYHFIAQLDKIIDIMKYVAIDQLKYNKKISRDSRLIIEQIHNSILLFRLLYHNIDSETISSLDKNRNDVKEAIWFNINKIPDLEIKMISLLSQTQELILDLTEFRIALEI